MTEVAQIRAAHRSAVTPAVGFGHLIRGRALVGRLLLLAIVVALAAGALWFKTLTRANPDALPPLPGVARVTPHVIRGGQPADFDLLQLRNAYRVRAVVTLRLSAADTEGDIAAGFGLGFLPLPIATDEAPTAAGLATLVAFLRRYATGSAVVYIHDDIGGGRAITTGLMLLMLRGESLGAATSTLLPGEERRLSPHQWTALVSLFQALTEQANPANAYREAVSLRW
jgi:hypothetical protein